MSVQNMHKLQQPASYKPKKVDDLSTTEINKYFDSVRSQASLKTRDVVANEIERQFLFAGERNVHDLVSKSGNLDCYSASMLGGRPNGNFGNGGACYRTRHGNHPIGSTIVAAEGELLRDPNRQNYLTEYRNTPMMQELLTGTSLSMQPQHSMGRVSKLGRSVNMTPHAVPRTQQVGFYSPMKSVADTKVGPLFGASSATLAHRL